VGKRLNFGPAVVKPTKEELRPMNIIQSFGVLSVAKIMGLINAIFGFVLMPFFLLIGLLGAMIPNQNGPNPFAGVGGVIFALFAPIFYGMMGFIFGAVGAFLYNLLAKWLGGIEVKLQPTGGQLSVGLG
jgi:hypothetical protein